MMFTLVIITIAVFLLTVYVQRKQRGKSQPQHPLIRHFDLLDENDEPLVYHNEKVQELKYFCVKDKGYHVSVWPNVDNQFDIIQFNIAGLTYRDNISHYIGEFAGTLEPEPSNPYDPNAIKILASDGHHVGYVPKDYISKVFQSVKLPHPCYCYIGVNSGTYFSSCYINI